MVRREVIQIENGEQWEEPTINGIQGHAHREACPREMRASVEKNSSLPSVVAKPPWFLQAYIIRKPGSLLSEVSAKSTSTRMSVSAI